ncbi:MAG: nucleoside monophosphate kinase [Candidatus Pacebacteria bacterium]|nr:nucleoside monophosphate kinase [Candidatus Paceibacterota bacterium]
MKKNINIIIMGPQGSGKGTQARFLAEKFDLQIFETGNVLREIANQDNEIGRKINDIINVRGQFVPWDIMKKEVFDWGFDRLDKEKGIIFDGTPRIMKEIEYWNEKLPSLGKKIDYIFYIDISKEESVKRISSRKLCKKNAHPLIVGKDLSEEETKCPICGSEVYRRQDDTPEKVLNRLQWNEENMKPVIEYYDQKKMITRIHGEKSIEEINEEILSYIK